MRIIYPTRRGWTVFLLAWVWFALAAISGTLFPFLLACSSIALTAASFVAALGSLRGIRVHRGLAGDVSTGQAASLPLRITNRLGRHRQPFVVVEDCPLAAEPLVTTVVPTLGPRATRTVERRVLAMRRGVFDLDNVVLRSGDPAGLFCHRRTFSCPKRMLVAPGAEPIADLHVSREEVAAGIAGDPLSATGGSQQFYGVREYNPSDGLRHIHWRSSARTRRLMVREFEKNAVMSVAVLLDAYEHFVSGPGYWSNLEYQIRAAASIARHVADFYCSFAFGAGGSRPILLAPSLASEAVDDVMYQLTTLKPGRVALAEVALELGERLPRNTAVFCFSLAMPRPLEEALSVLVDQGLAVRWFCAPRNTFAPNRTPTEREATALRSRRPSLEPSFLHPSLPLSQVLSASR